MLFQLSKSTGWNPSIIFLFKVNSRCTRKRCEICPKQTIRTVEIRSDVLSELTNRFAPYHLVVFLTPKSDSLLIGVGTHSKGP